MSTTMLQQPPNGVLCFNTPIGRDRVTAFVSESSLRARYGSTTSDQDMTLLYDLHRYEIDAAVLRRIEAGARQPVVLRVTDL